MAITYTYNNMSYDTEEDAQNAVVSMKNRLENSPTDWCEVKEVVSIGDDFWRVLPNKLSDEEIMNASTEKTYNVYSKYTGENAMHLTSSELSAKVTEFRRAFVNHYNLLNIIKVDTEGGSSEEGYTASFTSITPNEDMSGYV